MEILYVQNYNTLMREIKQNLNKWKDVPCSWVGRLNIVKVLILPKMIYRFNIIPIKVLAGICRNQQTDLNFLWKMKDLQ